MKLEAENISFQYASGGRRILNHVEFFAESGERVGIMAPSGFGKTTLLKILAGYEKPMEGQVLAGGKPLWEYRRYCPVQMIWQHPELSVNPRRRLKTVLDEGDWSDNPGNEDQEVWTAGERERARITEALGIQSQWLERFPVEVSGGELQRFCIARALGRQTKILLADEITTMLDLVTQAQIWEFLLKELERRKITLLAVSHSPELLEKTCDRIVRLG